MRSNAFGADGQFVDPEFLRVREEARAEIEGKGWDALIARNWVGG